jgi:predicted transcriptional regulator YdeE
MRIITTLIVAITIMVSLVTQGCGESQQASSAPKTSAKAEKPLALSYDFKDREAFTVMGLQTRITSADQKNPETYTKIWDAVEPYRMKLRPLSIEQRSFGATFPTNKKDAFDYLAGVSVHSDAMAPDINLVSRRVPAARYVVFKCTSQDMDKTYQYIYSEWLPGSRYKIDKNGYCFEQYAPKEWANRPVYIYIPIIPK